MMKNKQSKSLYIIFGVVIAVLLALIGYFAYLLIAPSDDANSNSNTVNATANSNANKNKNTYSNKNNANSNSNANVNTNTNSEDAGLVEPDNSNSNVNTNTNSSDEGTDESTTEEAVEEVVAGEGEEVITLYFPKDGASCGEVSPVQRAITPSEDLYGQIILADLAGPTADEDGYDNAASGIRLRWVEYTSEGSVIYVNEAYDELSDCDKETVDAQLIKTANTMFEVSANNDGEVIVGYPEGQDPNEETTDDNSNTNDEE